MKKTIAAPAALLCLGGVAFGAPFKDGDRVVFYGDSITHGGKYVQMVSDFYLTRYPGMNFRFYNSGVAGDNAGAAMTRFEDDVLKRKPTVVTMMFGMNDSWRDMYNPEKMKDPAYRAKVPQREKDCYNHYTNNMTRLAERIKKELPGTRLMYLTPTIFDEKAVQKGGKTTPVLDGTAAALARFAEFGRQAAAANGGEVIDWNRVMTETTKREQKKNPEFSLIGKDRVHPQDPGHLYMTWQFLKMQGATGAVMRVAVNAADGKVERSENATVSGFAKRQDGCEFTVDAKALPWAIPPTGKSILKFARVSEDLNQERLAVKGLEKNARYALTIDGTEVGTWTGDELNYGINLADNEKTPQHKQAAEVAKKNAERCGIERNRMRMFAASRWYLRMRRVNPDDMAAVQAHYDGLANKNGYFERRLPEYVKGYPELPALEKDQDARWAELLKMSQPKARRYAVKKLPLIDYDANPGRNPTVRHIQRTMKALAESTAEKPAKVRVLFYGQSIVEQGWSKEWAEEMKRRYPTAKIEVLNLAIGGYTSERLARTAESDLYPNYPDLLMFHVYGSLEKYEEIIRKTRERTTAEIVLWSSHLSRGQNAYEMLAERDGRTKGIEAIAKRHGCMYVDLNRKWCEMLKKNGWSEGEMLADGIHMHWNRSTPALNLYARFIYEDMARISGAGAEPGVSGTVEWVPAGDARVKRGADGTVALKFEGNRVVAVSGGNGAAGAKATLTVDGGDPAKLRELWYTSRPGRGPMWMPFVNHVAIDAEPVAEKWTLTYVEGTKPNADPIVYKVEGSVTGFDGTGNTKEVFRSKSGRAVLDPKDMNPTWQYKYAKREAKPGFTVKWETRRLFAPEYAAKPAGERTVLVQNLKNGKHELKLAGNGGNLGIAGFLVYKPAK